MNNKKVIKKQENKRKITYKDYAKKNEIIRNMAGNPYEKMGEIGFPGEIAAAFTDKATKKMRHDIAYRVVGATGYKSGSDPSKGSDLYNDAYLKVNKFFSIMSTIIVCLLLGGSLLGFIMAEGIKKIVGIVAVSIAAIIYDVLRRFFQKIK